MTMEDPEEGFRVSSLTAELRSEHFTDVRFAFDRPKLQEMHSNVGVAAVHPSSRKLGREKLKEICEEQLELFARYVAPSYGVVFDALPRTLYPELVLRWLAEGSFVHLGQPGFEDILYENAVSLRQFDVTERRGN
ncbi:hypothetical protein FOZ61_007174 [Perkinsus olseni]|uniref:Uncharacterized protein n=1 Tax=Perkinsus olseni TaxID=32597 RepID=A0A7J6LA91_PEROL|nr:hypothetical protein FOZ61_007174 [Perkinsus olseni]